MSEEDWADMLSKQSWHYETWHELSRPKEIPRVPYVDPPDQLYDATNLPPRRFRRSTPSHGSHLRGNTWTKFWTRNKDLLTSGGRGGTTKVRDVFASFARTAGLG